MKVLVCEGCGKENDPEGNLVQQCCTWPGNRTLCHNCKLSGAYTHRGCGGRKEDERETGNGLTQDK